MTLMGFACPLALVKSKHSRVKSPVRWQSSSLHGRPRLSAAKPGTTRCTPASWNFPRFFFHVFWERKDAMSSVPVCSRMTESALKNCPAGSAWTWPRADDEPTDKEGWDRGRDKKRKKNSKTDLPSYPSKRKKFSSWGRPFKTSKATVMWVSTEILHVFLLCNPECVLGKYPIKRVLISIRVCMIQTKRRAGFLVKNWKSDSHHC